MSPPRVKGVRHVSTRPSRSSVLVDFEVAIHQAAKNVLKCTLLGCKFHLTQAWWRKIQHLGLACDYKNNTEVGKYLRTLFGLPYLSFFEVNESLDNDFSMPKNQKVRQFVKYLKATYTTPQSLFPPIMWAQRNSTSCRTTNACESFHSKFNKQFNCSKHPNIFAFVEGLLDIQIDSVIAMNSVSEPVRPRKKYQDKLHHSDSYIQLYITGQITRAEYVKKVSSLNKPVF